MWDRIKNFIKLITPWIKWGWKQYKEFKNAIKVQKALESKK